MTLYSLISFQVDSVGIYVKKIYNYFTYQHLNVLLASHDFELPSNDMYMTQYHTLILDLKYM